jgi:hypothetical protein
MISFWDRNGNPITRKQWAKLFHDRSYQQLAYDEVDGYAVSTVWLGFDHGHGYSEWPLLFETMVFGGERGREEQRRYETEAEALAGHAELLAEVSLLVAATR